jgi:GxxExxY protein
MKLNDLTERIILAALDVHTELGPGLLESAYRRCLCHELALRELSYATEMVVPVMYKGLRVESGYRLDVLVEKAVIVEIKAVKDMEPIFEAQLLTHLRMMDCRVGLLMNFNVEHMKDGITRRVNRFRE